MRLKVEQKHIDAARKAYENPHDYFVCCPIAQAAAEEVHGDWNVQPDKASFGVAITPDGQSMFRLSRRANHEACRFDDTREFKPGAYVLTPITETGA